MPKKAIAKEPVTAAPARATNRKTTPTSQPAVARTRVTTVKHSKAASPAAEKSTLSAHERIAQIAYGYWEARGFQPGSPEQDWLRAEQEFLLQA